MARKNMSVARIEKFSAAKIGKAERHNERKNESYANINVVPERIPFNISFKSTDGLTYNEYFDKLVSDGTISTRGLKPDATLFNEIVLADWTNIPPEPSRVKLMTIIILMDNKIKSSQLY